ncbi:hypothetical protein GCM10010460_05820 [Microbacterium terrae]|nr:hypothetical protein GCM10017594_03410 [Microbacterium terrae]
MPRYWRGELATRPLREAKATDTFVLTGGDDVFEPTLTFHGFRFAEVSGYPGELTEDDIEAVVVHSRMTRTGYFECSDPRVDRLVENAVWGQRGNFLDVPTDCPQRDERLGRTGDLAVFASTATFQFDCADFLHGWLLDLEADTRANGYVPLVVPDLFSLASPEAFAPFAHTLSPTAIWGDAAIWVPEALWWAYGDVERLAMHYPAMVMHLESIIPLLSVNGLWDQGFQLGDWLDPTAPPEKPREGKRVRRSSRRPVSTAAPTSPRAPPKSSVTAPTRNDGADSRIRRGRRSAAHMCATTGGSCPTRRLSMPSRSTSDSSSRMSERTPAIVSSIW